MRDLSQGKPYALVCRAFERNELEALLLGDKGYGCKKDLRNDYTDPDQKTDLGWIYMYLVYYYVTHHQAQWITDAIFNALMAIIHTHAGIDAVSHVLALELLEKGDHRDHLHLDVFALSKQLKHEITEKKAALIQEKRYRGHYSPIGLYGILTRRVDRCTRYGIPSFMDDAYLQGNLTLTRTSFIVQLPEGSVSLPIWDKRFGLKALRHIPPGDNDMPQPRGYPGHAKAAYWLYGIDYQMDVCANTQLEQVVDALLGQQDKILPLIHTYDFNAILRIEKRFNKKCVPVKFSAALMRKVARLGVPLQVAIETGEFELLHYKSE